MSTVRLGGEHSDYAITNLNVSPEHAHGFDSNPTRMPPSVPCISAKLNQELRGSQLEILMSNEEALSVIKDLAFWLQHISRPESYQPERLNPKQVKLVNCIQQLAELALEQEN